jgi:hypothetical protein
LTSPGLEDAGGQDLELAWKNDDVLELLALLPLQVLLVRREPVEQVVNDVGLERRMSNVMKTGVRRKTDAGVNFSCIFFRRIIEEWIYLDKVRGKKFLSPDFL